MAQSTAQVAAKGSSTKAKGRIKQSHNLCRAVQQAGIQLQDGKCFWLRHLHIHPLGVLCSLLLRNAKGMQEECLRTLANPRELSSLKHYRNTQKPQTEHEGATRAKQTPGTTALTAERQQHWLCTSPKNQCSDTALGH